MVIGETVAKLLLISCVLTVGFGHKTCSIHLVHSEKFHVLCVTLNAFCHKSATSALHSTAANEVCAKIRLVAAQYRQKLDFHFLMDNAFCDQTLQLLPCIIQV